MRAHTIRHRATLIVGLIITLLMISIAVVSQFWTPLVATKMNIVQKLKPPMEFGLLGTDHFGRDLASMLMIGAWNSLSTSFVAVAIGATVGSTIGIVVAIKKGLLQSFVMRLCDVIFAVPPILSAMLLGAFIGAGRYTAIIAIAVFMVPVFARLTLGAAMQIWTREYVSAAIGIGQGAFKISVHHVLPNVSNLIIVQISIQLGLAILTEAGLSFLGLGLAPPAPTWGRMLVDSQTYISTAPWIAILPGLAIALTVYGFNMLGDGLRDLLDPRRRAD